MLRKKTLTRFAGIVRSNFIARKPNQQPPDLPKNKHVHQMLLLYCYPYCICIILASLSFKGYHAQTILLWHLLKAEATFMDYIVRSSVLIASSTNAYCSSEHLYFKDFHCVLIFGGFNNNQIITDCGQSSL